MLIDKIINSKYFVPIIIIFSLIAIVFTNQIILKDFPNSADEYSYLISAKLFSIGKLYVPSPEHREFFDFSSIINDGKFYSIYTPGWPFFLMLGDIIGLPMIINMIFAILTLIVVYLIAKGIFSEKTARIALLLMATNPFFIFNSASYFSHSSSLFFASIFAYFCFKNLESNKNINWLLMGAAISILASIRPLDAIVIALPFLIFLFIEHVSNKKISIKDKIKNYAIFISVPLILLFFLLHNYLQTGNFFLSSYIKYIPTVNFYYLKTKLIMFLIISVLNSLDSVLYLSIWVPFCLLFMLIALFNNKYKKRYLYLLFFIFCLLTFAYSFISYSWQNNEYGPRYLYSSLFTVFILVSVGIEKLTKRNINISKFLLIILLLLNLIVFAAFSSLFHDQVNKRMEMYNSVKVNNISNALIFIDKATTISGKLSPINPIASGTMSSTELTRNGIYFNNSVLYVHNLGKNNTILMKEFPDRKYYLWKCEEIKAQYIPVIKFVKTENIDCSLKEIQEG